jgi:hypothetical protein
VLAGYAAAAAERTLTQWPTSIIVRAMNGHKDAICGICREIIG